MILAADIGGTNARIATFAPDDLHEPLRLEVFASQDARDLDSILRRFLGSAPVALERATVAVAGLVREGYARPTNLGWGIDGSSIARVLGLESVGLINDLEATAWGIGLLRDDELVTLNEGIAEPGGNVAVIAAGTGLGEAGVVQTPAGPVVVATESGHAGFAPATSEQTRLMEFLRSGPDFHVSVEAVCSGPGLVNIYRWRLHELSQPPPAWLGADAERRDGPAAVTDAASAGSDTAASQALDHFVAIYGSEAGNLALRLLARGGVFLAGGIAMKLVDALERGAFMDAFRNKGLFRNVLGDVPVRVAVNDRVALTGAAYHATRQSGGS